jgi:hypothetical protein
LIYSKQLVLSHYAECQYAECRGALKNRQIYERAYPIKTPGIVKNSHRLKIIISNIFISTSSFKQLLACKECTFYRYKILMEHNKMWNYNCNFFTSKFRLKICYLSRFIWLERIFFWSSSTRRNTNWQNPIFSSKSCF